MSFNAFAVDVKVESNARGCAALLTSILQGKTSYVTASSVQKLSKNSLSLTDEKKRALKRDIFDMAVMVDKKIHMDLDIKAENIAWDAENKRFIMYEMSMKTKTTGFYIKDGFDGYLSYVTERLHYHGTRRTPASVNEIRMCSDNVLDVPVEFRKSFRSDLMTGTIDLKEKVIVLENEELRGCYKIESINYLKDQSFVNLSVKVYG